LSPLLKEGDHLVAFPFLEAFQILFYMLFYVYVLFSPAWDKIYIGFTSDLETRIKSHNELATKGWTTKFRPWIIVHTESFDSKALAMKREKQLKSAKGRLFIRNQFLKK
jgi:putative endonuclease